MIKSRRLHIICSIALALMAILCCHMEVAEAVPSIDEIVDQQLERLDLSPLEHELRNIGDKYTDIAPDLSIKSVLNMFRGQDNFTVQGVLGAIIRYFSREVLAHLSLLVRILVLSVLAVVIQRLQSAFGSQVSEAAYMLAYLVLMILAIQSFAIAIDVARSAINDMFSFMIAVLPLMMTLLLSMGHITSVAMFDPLLVVATQTVGNIVSFTILPIFYAAGIITLVDHLSDTFNLSKLADLIKGVGAVMLSVVFTVFGGLTILRGTAGAVADGVALRTGKYMTKNFFPIVGGMVSDAFETVLGCSLIIKNTVGVFGLVMVFFLCALPSLKLTAMILVYRVAAACVQPLGNDRIPEALTSIASLLTFVLAAVITMGIMLFILITAIVVASNATVMMR